MLCYVAWRLPHLRRTLDRRSRPTPSWGRGPAAGGAKAVGGHTPRLWRGAMPSPSIREIKHGARPLPRRRSLEPPLDGLKIQYPSTQRPSWPGSHVDATEEVAQRSFDVASPHAAGSSLHDVPPGKIRPAPRGLRPPTPQRPPTPPNRLQPLRTPPTPPPFDAVPQPKQPLTSPAEASAAAAQGTPPPSAAAAAAAPAAPRPHAEEAAPERASSMGRGVGAPNELQQLAALFWAGVGRAVQGEGPAEGFIGSQGKT